jgi:hypothetical protein
MTDSPLTRAERTGYRETSLHADVMAFLQELTRGAGNARLLSIGQSHEGRDMPLLVLSNAGLFEPAAARGSGLPVVLVINNIHAGEVEGKEASLMLAREIVRGPLRPLADSMVLLILPLFNVDGNERISVKHRALDLFHRLDGQIGPDGGVGVRYTGAGINLNRDHMKVEAVEMANLNRRVVQPWEPTLTIDCHTTDGSIHGYELTYGTAMNPAGHPGPMGYMRDRMLPAVTESLFRRTGIRTFFYGNFVDELDPSKGWATYSHLPRYGSNYRGLTGSLDILSETYSYLPFEERVRVNREFLHEVFLRTAACGREMVEVVRRAREETAGLKGDEIPVQAALERCEQPVEIVRRGFRVEIEIDTEDPRLHVRYKNFIKSRELKSYTVPYFGRFVGTKRVTRPAGYLIPVELREVATKLGLHGIGMRTVDRSRRARVDRYRILSCSRINSADYGSHPREEFQLKTDAQDEVVEISAGTLWVDLAQPLGTLAAYLLEPESDDGLATWGLIQSEGIYPILRLQSWLS